MYFLITETTANVKRRRRQNRPQAPVRIEESDAQLYKDVAEAAGGLVVQVGQEQLQEATGIIGNMSRSSLVASAFRLRPRRQATSGTRVNLGVSDLLFLGDALAGVRDSGRELHVCGRRDRQQSPTGPHGAASSHQHHQPPG